MRESPGSAPVPLDQIARLFHGDEGAEIVRRHGGIGPGPARFEILKSKGAAALLTAGDETPIALCACPTGPDRSLEIVRLDPSRDRGLRGRKLIGKAKRLAELCAPLFALESRRLVTYHPERRAVVRLEGRDRSGAPAIFYAKLLRRAAFDRARRLYDSLRSHAERAGLVIPLLTSDEHHAFVYAQAPGRSLHERLLAGEQPDLSALVNGIERLGEIEPPGHLDTHGLDAEKGATLKMLDRGRMVVPELEPLRDAVGAIDVPGCGGYRLVHRDLHDKQIFIDDGAIRFIDFEGAARGPRHLDAVNLAEHCRLRTLQKRAPGGNELGKFLLERFEIDPNDREVGLLTALTRARIAGVYAARPQWKALSLILASYALEKIKEVS